MKTAASPVSKASKAETYFRLGEIAVFNKILDQAQVDECLRIQARAQELGFPMKLGKVLVEKFYLDRITLSALLRAQGSQRSISPAEIDTAVDIVKFTPAEHDLLVQRVCERNLVRAEDLDACIEIQVALEEEGIDKQLGEICIEKGTLSRDVVSDVLARHETVRRVLVKEVVAEEAPPPRDEDPERPTTQLARAAKDLWFGSLAIEKGLVTGPDVEQALFIQFRMKELGIIKRIGEVLVEIGHLRMPDVQRILQIQRKRLSKISWSDRAELGPVKSEDQGLVDYLTANGILSQEEIDEARFVQRYMDRLGLKSPLGRVIVDKEYLDAVVIDGISKKLAADREAKQAVAGPVTMRAEGPVQVAGTFQLKSAALEDAYREILNKLNMSEEEAERPPPSSERRTLVQAATQPEPRAAALNTSRLSSKRFWLGLGAIAGVAGLIGGGIAVHALVVTRQRADKIAADKEAIAERIEEHEKEEEDLQKKAAAEAAERDRQAILKVLLLFQTPFTGGVHRTVLSTVDSLRERLEKDPLLADLEMFVGRSFTYLLYSPDSSRLPRAKRKELVDLALAHLEAASKLYGTGGKTLIGSKATKDGGKEMLDTTIHLPEWAPERRLYADAREPFFDENAAAINYFGSATHARQDLDRLRTELEAIQKRLSR